MYGDDNHDGKGKGKERAEEVYASELSCYVCRSGNFSDFSHRCADLRCLNEVSTATSAIVEGRAQVCTLRCFAHERLVNNAASSMC